MEVLLFCGLAISKQPSGTRKADGRTVYVDQMHGGNHGLTWGGRRVNVVVETQGKVQTQKT